MSVSNIESIESRAPQEFIDLIHQLRTQLVNQQTQIDGYEEQIRYQREETQPIVTSQPKMKINSPQEFNGKREDTFHFLSQCRLVFLANPTWTEVNKTIYACSFLRGTAFTWYSNREKMRKRFDNYEHFETELTTAFGETDLVQKSKMQLEKLRQTKSCAIYTTEFNRLTTNIGYSDPKSLIDMYRRGLKDSVKDLLLTLPLREVLIEAQQDAITCDERIYQRSQENKNSSRHHHTTSTSLSEPTPMEIDTIKVIPKGPISDTEKQRRKKENLCLYDGKSDCPGRNDINTCPNIRKRQGNGQPPVTSKAKK